jgi:hypothetical protein
MLVLVEYSMQKAHEATSATISLLDARAVGKSILSTFMI